MGLKCAHLCGIKKKLKMRIKLGFPLNSPLRPEGGSSAGTGPPVADWD